jgi:hypothetical protein
MRFLRLSRASQYGTNKKTVISNEFSKENAACPIRNRKQPLTKGGIREKRDIGRPRRRWTEQDQLEVNELYRTGLTALTSQRS